MDENVAARTCQGVNYCTFTDTFMQNTEELISRTYFETLGFCTRFRHLSQPAHGNNCRLLEIQKAEKAHTEVSSSQFAFQLFSSDCQHLHSALIILYTWPVQIWELSLLKSSKKLSAQIKKCLKPLAANMFEEFEDSFRLLPLPAWPTAEADRKLVTEIVEALGIDGIITYRTMLGKLTESPELPSSDHNPIPGALRMLKAFHLLSGAQSDLFS